MRGTFAVWEFSCFKPPIPESITAKCNPEVLYAAWPYEFSADLKDSIRCKIESDNAKQLNYTLTKRSLTRGCNRANALKRLSRTSPG